MIPVVVFLVPPDANPFHRLIAADTLPNALHRIPIMLAKHRTKLIVHELKP